MSRTSATPGASRGDSGRLQDLELDELVERLTPGEIQTLLDECDPDDPDIPPGLRGGYKCEKSATGPLDRQKLLDFISEQALNTPDIPDVVPFVPGTVRGKKWTPAKKSPEMPDKLEESLALDIDIGVDCDEALAQATSAEIVDLAGILGLHSMMNQDQFHASQSDKWFPKSDPNVGWNGITKSTPLKQYPNEEPNRTDPDEIIRQLKSSDKTLVVANLNNVPIKEDQFMELFDALEKNEFLTELSISNTTLGDAAAVKLSEAIASNKKLQKLNIESNNVSPQTLIKIVQAAGVNQTLTEIKASNQKAKFLGNKVEMAITEAIEKNTALLKVGLHFEFGDCRNRVAVHLQRNLDRLRILRLSSKSSTPALPAKSVRSTEKMQR